MSALVSAIEIARPSDEVFAFVTDPSQFVSWQENIVSGCLAGDGPPHVGTRCVTTRRIGFITRTFTSEIVAIDPPRRWALRGLDGPIRAAVDVTVEPVDTRDARARVTIAIDFTGRGIGKLLVPLVVRRDARREMPRNLERLKERLESGLGIRASQQHAASTVR